MEFQLLAARGGALGGIVQWFIRILIYDIIVTSIAEFLGVSRLVALFIFLGGLLLFGFIGYLLKQRMSPGVDDPI
jgi:hypothetical protein